VEILLSVNKLKHDLKYKYLCEIICKGLNSIFYTTDELTYQDQICMYFLFPILHPRPIFLYAVPLLQGSHPTCLNMIRQSLVCSPQKCHTLKNIIIINGKSAALQVSIYYKHVDFQSTINIHTKHHVNFNMKFIYFLIKHMLVSSFIH